MEYVLVSLRLWFCGGLGVLPRTLLYCTENVAGIYEACIGGYQISHIP